jgi:hypothetical protein
MKHFLKIFILVCVNHVCFSQTSASKADTLRQEGKLEAAITAYKEAYNKSPKNWKNTYNLASAYALIYQKDSAYQYLNIALKNDTSLWALADSDLYALIDDVRWVEIETSQLKKFQEKYGTLQQPEYAKQLLKVIIKDQALDYYIKQARNFYISHDYIPQWYYPLGELKQQIGTENYSNMQQLITKYGWPKYSKVGELAADAPLLCINHHENDAIRKKYLTQIKQSCFEGEGSCIEFAKIQDRILVNDGQLQMYGMQFRYTKEQTLEPFPIKNPEYVDKRRKEIRLEALKAYLKRKINYNWTTTQKN